MIVGLFIVAVVFVIERHYGGVDILRIPLPMVAAAIAVLLATCGVLPEAMRVAVLGLCIGHLTWKAVYVARLRYLRWRYDRRWRGKYGP